MTQIQDNNASDALRGLLNATAQSGSGNGKRRWLLGGALVALLAGSALLFGGGQGATGEFITEDAAPGNLLVTASASGTLQPTKSIDVGSEQSGTLATVRVQENDVVKKGQLLAELDTAKLKDSVDKSRAGLAAAEAAVKQKQATVAEARAALGLE